MNKEQEPTLHDVLITIQDTQRAIGEFTTSTEEQFAEIRNDISGVKGEIGGIKKDLMAIKAVMVDKDYLDKKSAEWHGDIMEVMSREDRKVKTVVKVLEEKKVLNKSESKRILAMPPFPQLAA